MLTFSADIKRQLISISEDYKVFLEGSILKIINHEGDEAFKQYLDTAKRLDKGVRIKRLDITKQIQDQNKELKRVNDNVETLNTALRESLSKEVYANKMIRVHSNQLEKQNRDLSEFSDMISHNLRAPIASILGIINLMKINKETYTLDDQTLFDHLETSTKKIDSILKDVSDILQIRDDGNIYNEPIFLDDVFNISLQKLETSIHDSGGVVVHDFSGASKVVATKSYLESIMFHLLSNSFAYFSRERQLMVQVTSTVEDGCFLLRVTDNGKGIKESHRDQIFEPFKKLDYSSKGKGIGLYLVKNHTEAMGGQLSVFSKLGEGSVFTIKLPLLSLDSSNSDNSSSRDTHS